MDPNLSKKKIINIAEESLKTKSIKIFSGDLLILLLSVSAR